MFVLTESSVDPSLDDGYVQLVTSNGRKARYACLSHCWGKSRSTQLTRKATLDANQHGIGIAEMPQTFQDATYVARKLGVRLLWIDSFCIVQDDEEDWEHESVLMADVYAQCLFVIAATDSADDDNGFLGPLP